MLKHLSYLVLILGFAACEPPQRNCSEFKEGTFEFTAMIKGEEKTTRFTRIANLEVAEFEGVIDSSSVKWINDCEYILKNLHPKNKSEEAPIVIKILTTSKDSYTFEYGVVGAAKKIRGTAKKTP